ncbi:hypothetical protein, partial [Rhodocaloribacter sp.]
MSNRPDLSNDVAHFTTDRPPVASGDGDNYLFFFSSCIRAVSILRVPKQECCLARLGLFIDFWLHYS